MHMRQSDTIESPELQAARLAREAQVARVTAASESPSLAPPAVRDPLRFCIWTTVALLAWIFSPPLVVAVFAACGFRAYWRAWRAGLRRSDCILRDPRLVMLYLGLLFVAGAGWTVVRLAGLMR